MGIGFSRSDDVSFPNLDSLILTEGWVEQAIPYVREEGRVGSHTNLI